MTAGSQEIRSAWRQHWRQGANEYDTFNRRVARWVDSNGDGNSDREELFVYDGDDVALDFVDANGATGGVNPTLTVRYLHGPAVQLVVLNGLSVRRDANPK